MKMKSDDPGFFIQSGSFRDPSGFLFIHEGNLFRQINQSYQSDYDHLMTSGLYDELVGMAVMVSHREVDPGIKTPGDAYKIIQPDPVDFISYPYEWSFSQLKDAALTTLKIQKIAFKYGMVLKDASAYNIQFQASNPVLIDTLSFERYVEGDPWIAYSQFCRHFLGPLLLMSHVDIRMGLMLKDHIDGIPLDLVSKLLPLRTKLKFSILSHIHLHSKSQEHFADKSVNLKKAKVGQIAFRGLIDSLEGLVNKLNWLPEGTEWADYYDATNYDDTAFDNKKSAVSECVNSLDKSVVWDIGANEGVFSRLPALANNYVLSFDMDPAAVEKNYLHAKKNNENILPLILDLTNPSAGIGWANTERDSLASRGPADVVFALALIHHLSISNNVPFNKIAQYFKTLCKALIVEFIPKEDSQVVRLLSSRKDIFTDYTIEKFISEFSKFFIIEKKIPIEGSKRTLFLMKTR